MSTTPAVQVAKSVLDFHSGKRAAKSERKKKPSLKLQVRRKPNERMRIAMLNVCTVLMEEGYKYREAEILLRTYLLEKVLVNTKKYQYSKPNLTHAAKRLGISRQHVLNYHERGKDLL